LNADEIREYRGSFTEPGKESPYRNRSVDENLDLFERMRAGEFEDGDHVLRARIDMVSPNIVMRDPVIYRIKKDPTTGRETSGSSIPCMTLPTAFPMPLKG